MSHDLTYPGVYVEELAGGGRVIAGVPTSITLFIGRTSAGPVATDPDGPGPPVASYGEFTKLYGDQPAGGLVGHAVRDFFANGGRMALVARLSMPKNAPLTTAAYLDLFEGGALDKIDIFNLLCIPPDDLKVDTDPAVWIAAANYCVRRRAMLIVDPPAAWTVHAKKGNISSIDPAAIGIEGDAARNAAVYFPRLTAGEYTAKKEPLFLPPSGSVAGAMARVDAARGVWKAPAGLEAALTNVTDLEVKLTDDQNGILNTIGINCLRTFPVYGPVIWGTRTLRGADMLADEYKYVPVRRLALFLEESIYRGTQWAVFEPNAQPLWASLRLAVDDLMSGLYRQGAFYSYFVTCDQTTTTQDDITNGIVNIVVGFAPIRPAEFVVLYIQQIAGQAAS